MLDVVGYTLHSHSGDISRGTSVGSKLARVTQ